MGYKKEFRQVTINQSRYSQPVINQLADWRNIFGILCGKESFCFHSFDYLFRDKKKQQNVFSWLTSLLMNIIRLTCKRDKRVLEISNLFNFWRNVNIRGNQLIVCLSQRCQSKQRELSQHWCPWILLCLAFSKMRWVFSTWSSVGVDFRCQNW